MLLLSVKARFTPPQPLILYDQGLRDRTAAPLLNHLKATEQIESQTQSAVVSGKKKNKCQITSVTEQDFKWPLVTVNLVILINGGKKRFWLC